MGYHCGPYGGFARRYVTKQERIDWLKEYQAALENEVQAVKERIQEIESV